MNELDRHDLEALKDLMEARLDAVLVRLDAIDKATSLLETDRQKKDHDLNQVRFRFVDRHVFEAFKDDLQKQAEADRRGKRVERTAMLATAVTAAGLMLERLA